jgi:preprotein translocase subunit SecA
MSNLLNRVLRIGEGRRLKALEDAARAVNALEPEMKALSDDELRDRYAGLRDAVRSRVAEGEDTEAVLLDVQAETFAIVREAGWRSLGMRHFDVQIMGGYTLAAGAIAEMKTGEGKTLVGTLAVCHRALAGKGVHVVTVNDYLAKRDATWMGPLYRFLGITVGVIQADMPQDARRAAYQCEITFGTNSEFGFDYLRDNLAVELDQCVQRGHHYALVDEVDSILIDEARTPLIISGQPEEAPATYYEFARIAKRLEQGVDYEIDEKRKTVSPGEDCIHKVEKLLGVENLYAPGNGHLVNHLVQSLKAESLYHRDVEYVVQDGEVKIVDEFTGRMMEGRRWSEGLHQAVEAKEGVKIEAENITVATVTIQNYFRMYDKLAGMTGTASTEANEFGEIYKLEVVAIPTNVEMVRKDRNDVIFKTKSEKFEAVADDIAERHKAGQPVLVGTISIEISEELGALLLKRGIPHNVLNAKQHEREAEIIKDAGQPGAVTIATNMAGRGVDIKLGEGVLERGGLYVLGTERHESRRIDNQLRGRSGRQGDPGESRFYLSAEDEVVRLFAGDRIYKILDRLKVPEGEPIEHGMLTGRIEGAQRRVEEMNFEIRKNVLKYDDVLNKQREVVYAERRKVLEGEDISELVRQWIDETVWGVVDVHTDLSFSEEWDLDGMMIGLRAVYPASFTLDELGDRQSVTKDVLLDRVAGDAQHAYEAKEAAIATIAPELMRQAERFYLLQSIDQHWRNHLDTMEYLREGIHLRGLAQKDPLVEYRTEGHQMFGEMMRQVQEEVVTNLFHFTVEVEGPDGQSAVIDAFDPERSGSPLAGLVTEHEEASALHQARQATAPIDEPQSMLPPPPVEQRVVADRTGRNDPCPCGSGKKYKNCHGA